MGKQRLQVSDEPVEIGVQSAPKRPATLKSRPGGSFVTWLGLRLLVVAILLGLLLFFAPNLVSGTGLWKTLVRVAAPEIAPQIDIKSLQLSWLAPIELRGLAVRDLEGQPLADVSL